MLQTTYKLIDFGFAKDMMGMGSTRSICGTPMYIVSTVLRHSGIFVIPTSSQPHATTYHSTNSKNVCSAHIPRGWAQKHTGSMNHKTVVLEQNISSASVWCELMSCRDTGNH